MTKYQPLWQQAGSYAASVDRGLLGTLWPAGGVTGAAVAAVANTMQVQAAPGTVAVPMQAGQGTELCRWDAAADSTVTLTAAPPSGQSRIDVYCVQVRDNAVDAGGNNDFLVSAVAGTPAASNPTVPATPANALALANITVPGAAANLNSAVITSRAGQLAQSPGALIGITQVQPAAQTSYTWGGAGVGMNDAAVTFVAPPSGRVLVKWSAFGVATAACTANVAMYSAGAQIGGMNNVAYNAVIGSRLLFTNLITGLTAGALYTFVPWGFATGASMIIYYGGNAVGTNFTSNNGPAITEVYAA